MRIINLVENEPGASSCEAAHGLSFYVETANHKMLFDTSPSEVVLRNAHKLGVDLTAVDTVILSHGHYDHSGGILAFVEINPRAKIYMQHNAGGEYYAFDGEDKGFRYIGIDKKILFCGCAHNGILNVMETLERKFSSDSLPELVIGGFHLMKRTEFSEADTAEVTEIENRLKSYKAHFATCHCTGLPVFNQMKEIMGGQLSYVYSGDEVEF